MDEMEQENPNSLDKNQKRKRILDDKACEVCGDRSTGKHYGVYSCDGCSGFYKRTCRRSEPWLCKGQGHCPVDKSSRNDCKACRLKKCIEIGMNLDGVYRRSRFNEELGQSPGAESPAVNAPSDMRVDMSPSPEGLGFPVATSQIRVSRIKTVMVKREDEQQQLQEAEQQEQQQEEQEQQRQLPQQQHVQSNENNQKAPASPKYYKEKRDHEFLARPQNLLPALQATPFTTPLTTMSCSPVSSPVRVSFTAQGSGVNTRPGAAAPPLSSQRFQPPMSFPSIQQNGYQSPPRSVPRLPTGGPVVNGHRMASTALVSFTNVQRHLQSTQMNLSELHQAVEPVSFHTSEPLHDAATRLLSVSLRFGRRLPCFRRLPFRDQVILLEEGWKELLLLDSVFWAFTLTLGGSPEAEKDQRRQQEIKKMQEALTPFKTLKLDSSEYACLKAVVLFRTNTQGLKAADQVEELQDEAQLILADYIWSRLPAQPARFGKILLSVAALRSLAEKPIEHLFFSAVPAKDIFESILSQVISTN
ncbi:photoreceptor-specific nuclear receptor-like isoform X2 [Orbicella faveolata]|uniref:photoreceptor-specific nuclear receptor-like isoform X2 n=1 Tax=Orbicella faveolata TaxID=48498 RepID=UPI0009E364FA|nr:photoreceptor-specific nuclear receptor-like isoform X2 [Orbicella faveolata]